MSMLTQPEQLDQREPEPLPRSVVAREGSELAEALRASGWVARAGWRTTSESGESIWQVRFELVNDRQPEMN
jgi:hypothetical protein